MARRVDPTQFVESTGKGFIDKKVFRRFISYYKPHIKLLLLDIIAIMTIAAVDLSYPQVLRYVINEAVFLPKQEAIRTMLLMLFVLFILYSIRAFGRYVSTAWGKIMGLRIETRMRKELFDKYHQLSFSYYDQHNTGDLMSRIISDLSDISEMAHKGPEVTLMASIRLLGASIIIATISWKLALALVIIAVLFTFILSKQNKKMKRIFLDNRVKISGMNSVLQDSLGGIRIVKAFANEILEQARFKKANKNYYESREDTSKAMASYMATTAIYFGMTHGAIIVLGGFLVIFGDLSAADLAISALYIGTFSFAIEAMINLMESFQKAGSGFRRFLEVMDMVPSIQDIPNAPKLHVSEGAIEYKHVNFSYEPNEPIIKDLNLRLEAGKTLALVGESGGGKTTICSLLMRFYEVDSGSILIDGQDIKTVSQESLRSAIGLVQQDVYLFDGTIYDNIAYGNMEASHEEIVLAAKKANISSFIDSLPDGYNTVVGERGTRLSGGQKQRIAIARIFLKDPKILILDEATSALDNESEHYVQESLNALAQGRTTLIIAHRLSTIKHADEIATIEQGRVIERGTHDELLAKGGTYAQYYEMQFAHQEF